MDKAEQCVQGGHGKRMTRQQATLVNAFALSRHILLEDCHRHPLIQTDSHHIRHEKLVRCPRVSEFSRLSARQLCVEQHSVARHLC
jgi:hypothetical protein